MAKSHLQLSPADKAHLLDLLGKGQQSSQAFKRATALLELDRGQTLVSIAATLHVTYKTVASWRDTYHSRGLAMLKDQPRSGRPAALSGEARAQITALACSAPPEGYGSWSLRLLADRAVELEFVKNITHSQVGLVLKKTNSNPT